jgi:hypothetical protein
LCRRPLRSRFTPTVWRPPRGRTHDDEKIRACKIRTKPGRGVHLRSHQIRRVSSCSSKNSYANNVMRFLLQISPIFQFLYLAVCSEATQNVDLLKWTLRSMLQNHVFSYILMSRSLITPSIFYFLPWLGGIELKVKSWYDRRYLRLRRGPTLRVTTTSALSWHRARAAAPSPRNLRLDEGGQA